MTGRENETIDIDDDVDARTPRQGETRQFDERPMDWQQPGLLPVPDKQPGWVFRWIRISTQGESDPTNASLRLREGWAPVRAKDHPELQYLSTSDQKSRWKDNVEIGGLVLCKMPERMSKQRSAAMRNMAAQQMEAVDNTLMKENDPRMPLLSPVKKSSTSFGTGRKP
jgi:hypothetical protein